MLRNLCVLLACVLLLLACGVSAEERASLVVKKSILEEPVYAARDVTVVVQIFNVGNGPAYNVKLQDSSWQASHFTPVLGLSEAFWDKIPSGTNVSHSFVIHPLGATLHGEPYNTYPSMVEYSVTPAGKAITLYTNDLPRISIYSRGELSRIKAPASSWLTFAVVCASAAVLPLTLWRYYVTNFELGVPRGSLKKRK